MVGGCLRCFFTYISVLLVGVLLHDVEASSCQHVVHRKVGDSVEFSACLPEEEVLSASWKYKELIIADKDGVFLGNHQFQDRLELNQTNFSLTVRQLTLQDSGDFLFQSTDKNDDQRPTVTITLHVHEPITKEPVVNFNSTWHPLNESCVIQLECSAAPGSSVSYSWTVRDQKINGPGLQQVIAHQEGESEFTCTVSNIVSEKSNSVKVECSNMTTGSENKGSEFIIFLSAAGGVCLLIIVIIGVVVCVCSCKKSPEAIDSNDLTVYADITDVSEVAMKPCTLYETIDNRGNTVPSGPQTVYDKIQLSRVRKESVSPYQEIS